MRCCNLLMARTERVRCRKSRDNSFCGCADRAMQYIFEFLAWQSHKAEFPGGIDNPPPHRVSECGVFLGASWQRRLCRLSRSKYNITVARRFP